jgi:histidinol-phosphate/aromatic aminotransferase/cobyric acid decarboxylase-like protein
MRPEPRPELAGLAPAVHGGGAPWGVFDFSTGVSPLAPPLSVMRAARDADLTRYPHATAEPLCRRIADTYGISADQVVAGAGSAELIWALARAFAGPGRRALVFTPSFGEYAQAIRASGAECATLAAAPPLFNIDREAALDRVRNSPSLAFICRPSNPCLSIASLELIDELSQAAPATLFVLDEAYLPLFDDVAPAAVRPNVALLRSLTKVFALPGVRLGYLIADAPIARAVRASLPPWNVSAVASAAGIAALAELERVPAIRGAVALLRWALARKLKNLGVSIDAVGGPFLLCRVGDARTVSFELLERQVRVRDCSSFGLAEHIRIGVRPEIEQERLVAALREVIRR